MNKIKSFIPNAVLLLAYLLKVSADKLSIVAVKLHMLFRTDLGKAALEAEKALKQMLETLKAQKEELLKKQQETVKNSQNVFILDPSKKQKE